MAYSKKTTKTTKKATSGKTNKKTVAPKKASKETKKSASKTRDKKTATKKKSAPKKKTGQTIRVSKQPPRIPKKRDYPDFHKERPLVFNEEFAELFAGRQIELEILWNGMAEMVKGKARNYAWLAQRKIGKSALFKRFCNIAFWEQDTIAPLYYELPDTPTAASEVADQMATTFVKQWMAFLTKDPSLMDIDKLDKAYEASQKLKGYEEKFQDIFESYSYHRERAVLPSQFLLAALHIVATMVGYLDQKCILFLDEVQLLATHIFKDGDPEKKQVRCEDVIGRTMQHSYIWLMLSGSRVSTLHYEIITSNRANKIGKRGLEPLWEDEAWDLVKKVVKAGDYEVYPGIEKDVYQLVGGNPYYIMTLFKEETRYPQIRRKPKSFTAPQELREVFEFEALDEDGEIFNFWREHYYENEQLLNANPPHRPGLSFEILKYIADETIDEPVGTYIPFEIFAEALELSDKEFKERIFRLEEADMVQTDRFSGKVKGIKDRVLSIVIRQLEYFRRTSDSHPAEEAQAIINQRLGLVENDVQTLKKDVDKAHKYIRKERGRISTIQGERAEMTIAKKIQAGEGWFEGMKVGELNNIRVSLGNGKGYQFDVYGQVNLNGHTAKPSLKPKTSKKTHSTAQKIALAVEVKEWNRKIYIGEARKFLEAINALQRTGKATAVVGVYISTRGFSGSAEKLLQGSGVYCGKPEDFGL